MNTLALLAPLAAPHWSPIALVAAAISGFLVGALAIAFVALWLRDHRAAGSGREHSGRERWGERRRIRAGRRTPHG